MFTAPLAALAVTVRMMVTVWDKVPDLPVMVMVEVRARPQMPPRG